jgi:hypothetical protein
MLDVIDDVARERFEPSVRRAGDELGRRPIFADRRASSRAQRATADPRSEVMLIARASPERPGIGKQVAHFASRVVRTAVNAAPENDARSDAGA